MEKKQSTPQRAKATDIAVAVLIGIVCAVAAPLVVSRMFDGPRHDASPVGPATAVLNGEQPNKEHRPQLPAGHPTVRKKQPGVCGRNSGVSMGAGTGPGGEREVWGKSSRSGGSRKPHVRGKKGTVGGKTKPKVPPELVTGGKGRVNIYGPAKRTMKLKHRRSPFAVVNKNIYPTRIAIGPSNRLYVTDAKVGSVFIYDINLKLIGELKGLNIPLGIAVSDKGWIFVGTDGGNSIEVFNPAGKRVRTIAKGQVAMPTDMAIDSRNDLYVVDSKAKVVRIFNHLGTPIGTIGARANMSFPVAIALRDLFDSDPTQSGIEIYVADQGTKEVKVFSRLGILLRVLKGTSGTSFGFGGMMSMGMGGFGRPATFVRMQSIALDRVGNLHVLDCYTHEIKVIDPATDIVIRKYGQYGKENGQLNLPLDVVIRDRGEAVVTNAGGSMISTLSLPREGDDQ